MKPNQFELSRKSTGRTTRLIDNAVQKFFSLKQGDTLLLLDHEPTRTAQLELLKKFCNRMKIEHPNEQFEVDEYNRLIKKL